MTLQLNTNSDESDFMAFWKSLIDFARSYELPEPRYGEARDYYADFKSYEEAR